MEILYGKKFSKDIDAIRHETDIKAHLLKLIETIREAKSFSDLKGSFSFIEKISTGDFHKLIPFTDLYTLE